MRRSRVVCAFLASCLAAAPACTGTTSPAATLVLTTAPDLAGRVSSAELERGNGPAGPYAQYDLWVTIPPATAPTAGVVVSTRTPVFVRGTGGLVAATARDIRAGDQVQVWRDRAPVAYGAVEGPPGAPTYVGSQVLILR